MKSKLRYLPLLLAALVALGAFSACHKADTADSDYMLLGERVSQHIQAGQPDSAVPLVRREMERAQPGAIPTITTTPCCNWLW